MSDNFHLQQLTLHHRPVSKHNSGRLSLGTTLVTLGISALTIRCGIHNKFSTEICETFSHFLINKFLIQRSLLDMDSLLLAAPVILLRHTKEHWNTTLHFKYITITVDNLRDVIRPLRMFKLQHVQCSSNRECRLLRVV